MTILRNFTALFFFIAAINLANAKPNVLLIVCDDLNTHVSTSGYPHIKTPHLDRLAKAGITFNRAYCQYPVCGPSRASFLSGLYPESSGVLNNKVDIRNTRPGTVSLPQFMKENGYWTGGVGKIFHSARHEPGDLGWNEYHRFENDEFPFVAEARARFEAKHGSVERGKTRRQWKEKLQGMFTQTRGQQQPGYGPSGLNDAQHRDGRNARKAVEWLDKKSFGEKPFFISTDPHERILEGTNVSISCQANGLPLPTISWTRDNRDVISERIQQETLGDLTITNVKVKDEGVYICAAENMYGKITTRTNLEVIRKIELKC